MGDVRFEADKFIRVLQDVLQAAPSKQSKPATQQSEQDDMDMMDMKSIMAAMDTELGGTSVRKTFVDQQLQDSDKSRGGEDDEGLDLDFDVVKHLLESVSHEHGMPGPASTLLNELYKTSKTKK